jgi:phosphate transport system ATP-binding protein
VYARDTDVNSIRTRIGMLLQQPVIFPTTIRENVLFGAKRLLALGKAEQTALVESALCESSLWDEVKDRLQQPASALSVGQQQRLCLARALAVQPEVLLMDEPTSALDPRSTAAIEELLLRLKTRHTIVIVTHNITQAPGYELTRIRGHPGWCRRNPRTRCHEGASFSAEEPDPCRLPYAFVMKAPLAGAA